MFIINGINGWIYIIHLNFLTFITKELMDEYTLFPYIYEYINIYNKFNFLMFIINEINGWIYIINLNFLTFITKRINGWIYTISLRL